MAFIGVVAFIAALLISVMIHEAGHYLTAKKFGMKVTEFSLVLVRRFGLLNEVRLSLVLRRYQLVAIAELLECHPRKNYRMLIVIAPLLKPELANA